MCRATALVFAASYCSYTTATVRNRVVARILVLAIIAVVVVLVAAGIIGAVAVNNNNPTPNMLMLPLLLKHLGSI